jgi:isopentenyldiphosphate isomerase
MKTVSDELFPVVDPDGNVVGSATRGECHGGSMLLHPVVHLHVVGSDGSLLLQKRSMAKDIQPGKWDTAVGGHVDLSETPSQAVVREAAEELGIDASAAEFVQRYIFESEVERELVHTFFLTVNPATFNASFADDEIDEIRFWTPQELTAAKGTEILTRNFELEMERILPKITDR